MPDAALRPCSGGCHALVKKGRCQDCSRKTEQVRGSAWQRGYRTNWNRFRTVTFPAMLADIGLLPTCGAALPDGPQTKDSQCKAQGYFNADRLQLDHEPPLRPEERDEDAKVCDPKRVQYLCYDCHRRKTKRQNLS